MLAEQPRLSGRLKKSAGRKLHKLKGPAAGCNMHRIFAAVCFGPATEDGNS
jgi:hypothetical protein